MAAPELVRCALQGGLRSRTARIRNLIRARAILTDALRGEPPSALDLDPNVTVLGERTITSVPAARTLVETEGAPGAGPAVSRWRSRWSHAIGSAIVHGPTGLIVHGDAVINASGGCSIDKRPRAEKSLILDELAAVTGAGLRGVRAIDEPAMHAGYTPRNNYYHWTVETLPRILATRAALGDFLVIIPESTPFMEQSLTSLGFRFLVTSDNLLLKHTYVTDPPDAIPHPDDLARLRSEALACGPPVERSRSAVYVSRVGETRSPAGEPDLIAELRSRGVTIFSPRQGASWSDQVRLFSAVDVIVGPHGAGLSNAVYAEPSTMVIELAPEAYAPDYFEQLSRVLGQQHVVIPLPAQEAAPFGVAMEAAGETLGLLARGGSGGAARTP